MKFSEPVDSEIDRWVWVQACPFLDAIGGYAFEQQTFEAYFFKCISQDLGLLDDDG